MAAENDTLESLQVQLDARYRVAMLFCLPLFAGLALMFLEVLLGVVFPSSLVFGLLVIGMAVAAVPVTRYHRVKSAYEKEKKLQRLALLASAFEAEK